MSRETFIASMRTALDSSVSLRGGQPRLNDLHAYMATFRDDPEGALDAYREYARSFYIHIATSSNNQSADVVWPGGSCDRWSELTERPRHQHRRVIDCEGFAYMADELLTAAGWDRRGYQVLYVIPHGSQGWDYHIVVVMDYPGPHGQRVYIGSQRVSPSAVTEAHHVWQQGSFNAHFGPVEATAQRAIDEAMREVEAGPQREVAPLGGRRSALPSPFGR